jgi:uncharacterized protein (TIGR03083 family)
MEGAVTYQRFTMTTGDELWRRIELAQRRFAEVCSEVPAEGRAWRSEWTAREVALHVLSVVRRYARLEFREPSGLGAGKGEIQQMNAEAMRASPNVSMQDVLTEIETEMGKVRALLPEDMDLAEQLAFYAGATIDGAGALANLMGELAIHGHDVALGAGRRHSIDHRDAVLVINALVQVAPSFVQPDSGCLRVGLRVRGGVPWMLDIADGKAVSRPWAVGEPVDAVVRGPARTLLFAFYKRHSIAESIRRGMIVTGGRRPWKALSLPSMIESV